MLLQTNSYIVPRDKRMEHARLLRRFRQVLLRLGCDHFEVYEQVGANWNTGETTGRFVQIMRFRDRKHQMEVQAAERTDPIAQGVVREFCEMINFPYQQQQGLFAVGFYTSFLRMPPQHTTSATSGETSEPSQSQPHHEEAYAADQNGAGEPQDQDHGMRMMSIGPDSEESQNADENHQPVLMPDQPTGTNEIGQTTDASQTEEQSEDIEILDESGDSAEAPTGAGHENGEHADEPMTAEELLRVQSSLAGDTQESASSSEEDSADILEALNLDESDDLPKHTDSVSHDSIKP